jgi:8-oxo-dGTP pyrophosphatase MutT (NUDIX family)
VSPAVPPGFLPGDHPDLAAREDLAAAVATLQTAVLSDPVADAHRRQVLDFVADHPDAAFRTCVDGHLTGSALVVDTTGSRTLLLLHRKLGRWFQPGGHADGDTNLVAVAHREATEETGVAGLWVLPEPIDVDVHRVAPPGEVPHLHLDTRFLVVAPDGSVEQGNEESLGLRWVTEAELDGLHPPVDPGTRRLVTTGLARARRVLTGPASP